MKSVNLKRKETVDMEERLKLTGPELQVEILRRMGYTEESPRCENCKYYRCDICDDSECVLIPLMNMKIHDDGYCNYYETKNK